MPTYRRTKARPSPVLGPVKAIIDQWLAEDEKRPPKQRHTARRIYERLVAEYDFQGAESTVRRYVGRRRRTLRTQAFIPLTYAPGQSAQVDFVQAQVVIAGKEVTAHLFCLRLSYSKQPFVMAFPVPNREAFLEGHVHAFHFLECVPHQIVYDNLKAAVKRVLMGHRRQEQDAFIAFRSHYLFESRFCRPAQGHETVSVW